MNIVCKKLSVFALGLTIVGCVDYREVRNGLEDEAVYLTKGELTTSNPKLGPSSTDTGWLMKVTTVKASSPNIVGDYAFPGFESDARYVQMRFQENALQILDGRKLQDDNAEDPNDDLSTSTERVMLEFAGRNVDVKLRENLDGERTNWLEENVEAPWQRRQKFKVDFEKSNLDPISTVAWFYGDYLADCASTIGSNLVPGSFEWDPQDQYMSFVVEVTYKLNLATQFGGCWDLVSLATGTGSSTIQYRFSFYRPGPSAYAADGLVEEIGEKDEVNKKYGAFQVLNTFRDEETGLLSARSLLQRWNPNRAEPVVFYFHPGFPERFKPMFDEIKAQTNRVLEEAGAKLRFDFREWNDGGIERQFGDLRYSFVVWHQDIDTTRGLLGYGPSSTDPRTGEVISANLNLYNVGLDYYRYLIQAYLEDNGGIEKASGLAWEETACTPGTTTATTGRLRATLFNEMRRVMELPEPGPGDDPSALFIPEPHQTHEAFMNTYHRLLPEVRYTNPGWNQYVYRPSTTQPINNFGERLAVERDFKGMMEGILLNQNPFEGASLYGRDGIQKQVEFVDNFRKWRRNHDHLQADQEMMMGLKNVYAFDANDAVNAISKGARRCKANGFYESDEEYSERIIEDVVFHVAIHEFGHNLSLRHNFYGSVDAKHMKDGEVSASVMDYVASWEEAGSKRVFGEYDESALQWIYGDASKRAEMMTKDLLYCTDEHRQNSPLCTAHDLGVTPAQITLNAIERYDFLYSIRNRRAFRKFWDTSGYVGSVYSSIFPLLRMMNLAAYDWGGGGVKETLKRLDQVDEARAVLSDPEYDEIAIDVENDLEAANALILAFFDAVINQPASFRNFQTELDPYYGDVLRLGIVVDKLYAMFAFMDFNEVYNYNPNVYDYYALYDIGWGPRNAALSQRVLDNMLGSGYDTFRWFRYLGIGIFASVTNTNSVGSAQLKDRIAIERYENMEELTEAYGDDVLRTVLAVDNPQQTFVHDGEVYVYTFLPDRAWHLVARQSRSPVSFQFMRDYNAELNTGSESQDNFGLKTLLAYHEYYNNFVGF
ncbi:MAG: zinc-dependent metalloprotease [Deltaproteobacteria bacterium]|nr:zinc-dependent metalloprotease [Deltaproteobacteria bacterium]